MSVIVSIEQLTFRKGPSLKKYGDHPVDTIGQGKVEHDRYLCLYGLLGHLSHKDFTELLTLLIELGSREGWRGIRWTRIRKDGREQVISFALPSPPVPV